MHRDQVADLGVAGEMDAVAAISFLGLASLALAMSSVVKRQTAFSMPRFKGDGVCARRATLRRPS